MPFIVVPLAMALTTLGMGAVAAGWVAFGIVVVGAAALLIGGTILIGKLFAPKKPKSSANTLTQSINPDAFRVLVLGETVAGNDVRYWEVYGSAGYDQVIVCATH